jgi:hypothetical protein
MIKMDYPTDPLKVQAMNDAYFSTIEVVLGDYGPIDIVLSQIKMANGSDLNCKKLVTAPFHELTALHTAINLFTDDEKKIIAPLSNYSDGQPLVAKYFMEQQELPLSSCFYCNIDSIYAFSQLADYWGPLDFIQRADSDQLQLIKGIGKEKAEAIIAKREEKQFENLEELKVSPTILERVKILSYSPTHNHFTLDHFHHQSTFIFLRLCLYNFIPSCYVCNSKYKNAYSLFVTRPEASSPSSASYSFHDDVQFKVYFSGTANDNVTIQDFAVDLDILNNHDSHCQYLKVLRIRGRYLHHKREALRLIKLKTDYPQARLEELSQSLSMPLEDVKRLIFGADLFEKQFDNSTLIKYKRDIAKNIKLLD